MHRNKDVHCHLLVQHTQFLNRTKTFTTSIAYNYHPHFATLVDLKGQSIKRHKLNENKQIILKAIKLDGNDTTTPSLHHVPVELPGGILAMNNVILTKWH